MVTAVATALAVILLSGVSSAATFGVNDYEAHSGVSKTRITKRKLEGGIHVPIADYYHAYVIPDLATKPSTAQVAALVSVTKDFWDQHFQQAYQGPGVVYTGLTMTAEEDLYDAGIPEERFNFYLTFNTELSFDEVSQDALPSPDDIYNNMLTADFANYIANYVRKLATIHPEVSTNPFLRNNEIWVGPLPSASTTATSNDNEQGGTSSWSRPMPTTNSILFRFGDEGVPVHVPGYYQAYVIPDLAVKPKPAEISALVQLTMEFWDQHFRHAFPGPTVSYKGIEMDIDAIQFEAGIPEEKFNYLIAFNTVLFFGESSDVNLLPTPDDIYNDMIKANFAHYIRQYVRKVAQFYPDLAPSPFLRNKEVWVGPFASATADVPTTAQESTTTFGRPLPPYDPLSFSTMKEGTPVRVSDYYHAYVIPDLATKPSAAEVAALVSVTMDFWEQHFKHVYPTIYNGIEMTVEEQLLEAGIPDERFNYYIRFETVLFFDSSSPSTLLPSPDDIYNEMLTANFQSYIRYYVRKVAQFYPEVNPSPFLRNKEMWLGPFASPAPEFATSDHEEETSISGRPVPPYESLPFSMGSEEGLLVVPVPTYFQAYVIPDLASMPSKSETSALVQVTMEFWDKHFHDAYLGRGVIYRGLEMDVVDERFNEGLPEEKFNLYLTFKTLLRFDQEPNSDDLPSPGAIISSMVRADFVGYLRHYVRQIDTIFPEVTPNPFGRVNEVKMGNL